MFMVATEPLPSGYSNESVIIGEQLNTPGPENVCSFEYSSFDQLGTTEAKVNPTNVVFSTSSNSITKRNEKDCNNNSSSSDSMHDKMEVQPFELEYSNVISPITPPPSVRRKPIMSWDLESRLDEVLLSPESYINTPLDSIGVASPASISGDAERKQTDELETCIDFNTIVDSSEGDDYSIPLHEEIEQLSNSFYCKSNNLVSVKVDSSNGADVVSPSFLLSLEKESIFPDALTNNTNVASDTLDNERTSSVANTMFEIQPSIVNSFFSDACDDDDLGKRENLKQNEHKQNITVAAARPQAALYTISSGDETFHVIKTQTQLEHNYTIKLPFDSGASHYLSNKPMVKEENLLQPFKPREQQASTPQKPPIVRRKLFQRINNKMSNTRRRIPELKLKIINPVASVDVHTANGTAMLTTTQMVMNTPELTNEILDLEAEVLKQEDEFDLLAYINSGTDYEVIEKSPIEEKPTVSFPEAAAVVKPVTDAPPVEAKPQSTICNATLSDLFNPAKRKLPTFTIDDIDQLTESTNNTKRFRFKSATSSTTSSVCGDNASEASSSVRPAKRRGRPPKTASSIRDRSEYEHLSEADMRYREQRDKNNEASRKSRINRKDREQRLEDEASQLNRQHELLVNEEQQLIKECNRWRKAVMRLALL
ncbi:uncharacterized protein LOC129721255 [Wyeomyia smithii]|uniref:uncharacterized protein LOC129721255 n=1 Tax=Wyeomyia smithii TaxID=174621 RepID=UPI002467D517|nr:uncharacterized protein LOC129721255 [Wyeomyia smithii]XP_055529585.1 uncharacterized protein LOC129721255 [Wyeomyia smithii]XP_055529594.1 uncharacterized protein LOC129721255 [Wyeomyia smithii]